MTVNPAAWKGSTFVRLGHRWATKRMWWDDWIAIIPLLGNILDVVIMWLDLGGGVESNSMNVLFSPWFGTFLFYIIVCAWYNMVFKNCVNNKGALVGLYATMVYFLLVISPLTMLWKIKLPRTQRRLVLALFSSSLVPLLASVVYCVIWGLSSRIGPDFLLILRIMSQLQAGISLLVCNLLVVTMLFYRIVRREIVPDPAAERPPQPQAAPSTEKQISESTRNTSTLQTQLRVEEVNLEAQSTIITQQSSLSPSLVLTSIYDESTQQSSFPNSSVHESTFSRYDEENNINASQFSWSFSEKSKASHSPSLPP
ncbi:hypothetical protein JR316_0002549 [Psilocybe cubensis]|uniref:Uncharacterized protein n=2 Tax=Psilocybe cubensis TaxID=181762 RepID=A0ACB8HD83_PSICU|nr:hypothetical protein JR316_0002549 [Psilocybe cubensis]KAH9485639.1 hypothetical protein JR316_0002549 [Psilocybe cubensis]